MPEARDPEKDYLPGNSNSTSAHDSESLNKDESDPGHLSRSPSSSTESTNSHNSINLQPRGTSQLERAITADSGISAHHATGPELTYTRTGTSIASRHPSFEVDFAADDPEDPRNWPFWYKGIIIAAVSFGTWTVVLYSTSYTSSLPGMMGEFHLSNETIGDLGVTTYLLGLACGSLILAPLSEIYGRRPVYLVSLLAFSILVLPCALANGIVEVLVVRFFGAVFGAAMISNAPGTVSDIVHENYRALAFSVWSIGPMNGPVTGPLIGGFTAQYLGWRWTNWLVMILSGAGWALCATIKETYAPSILKKRVQRLKKETGDDRWWCRYEESSVGSKHLTLEVLKTNIVRPFVLTLTEPILWFWDTYIAVIYAILYLCFVAYPIIYTDDRGWSLGITGLAFAGIGTGTVIGIITEPLIRRWINSHPKEPDTGRVAPEASICIVCVAAFLCPIGQLWFSWTCFPTTIHWILPILAGVPFGLGNCWVFIYSSNYLAGSYGIYTASALAGNTVVRSLAGGTLPLAGPAMYSKLGPQWAGTLLGLTQVVLIPIPFVFYKWGKGIRMRSPLIRKLREDQEKNERRAERARRKQEKRTAGRIEAVGMDEADIGVADEKSTARVEEDKKDEL
ncbi:major facilitator superfamily domain-containing protein [Xylogone sp. PMI_703]|nr:major facilitator superfamily domain-containing protein [Xylogone sp. PMI_703]